ncbi:MAG: bifunctional DNA primase/polymerase [Alphaproteobacteria bacterium]|nr:bifunctional DNA primase/polymerase [Alphaproteobacteria bacterium]
MSPLDIARNYSARGWAPLPIPHREKKPVIEGWPKLVITEANVAQYFNGAAQNIGVQLGPKSGGLADVDLDCPEAVKLAQHFLEPTNAVFGRKSNPASHHLYVVTDPKLVSVIKYVDGAGGVIIELRLGQATDKGTQTVFPGSVHESGEPIEWVKDGAPLQAPFAALARAVRGIAVASLLLRHWPDKGSRHDFARVVGGFLARADVPPEAIERMVAVVATEAGDEEVKDRRRAASDAAAAYADGKNTYGLPELQEHLGGDAEALAKILHYDNGTTLPVIKVRAGELSKITSEAEKVLADASVCIYQRAGTLVRPIIEDVEASRGRRTKVARLLKIETIYLRDLLGRVAAFRRYDNRSKKLMPIDAPSEVASTILARVGEWTFSTVAGVISTPTMRPDGTLLTEAGYDPATRLLLVEPPLMPAIPDEPTRDDALAALKLLEDLLEEFPLVDDVAKAVALSALITPVARGAFTCTPMHVARAPVAGSGKSFLLDIVAAIAIGQVMPVMAAGRNEEETEKRLGAALLAGQPLISIDNVSGELAGDALWQIVERPVVEIRILGKSERIRIEARATSVFCTGNNIVLVGDLCRRAITITLNPNVERPELRQFKSSPVDKVLADRGKYIASCLTICRAYFVAGRPHKAPKLASFEDWSDTVRSALIWLGKADAVYSMELARAEDPELGALRAMLQVWAEVIGVGGKYHLTIQELIDRANELTAEGQPRWPTLQAAVRGVGVARHEPDARCVGNWARSKKDRVVGNLRLLNRPDPKGGSDWWIEQSDGTEKAGSYTAPDAKATTTASAVGDTIKLIVDIIHTTDKGGCRVVGDGRAKEVWLPEVAIKNIEYRADGLAEIEIPLRLAKDKGMLDWKPASPMPQSDEIPF